MNINQNLFLLKQSSSKSFKILHYIEMPIIDANKPDIAFKDKKQLFIKIQCPGNENRMDVAPKININTCSCGSSWYGKIRYKQKFAANPQKVNANRNPENFTNKHIISCEKSVADLNQ